MKVYLNEAQLPKFKRTVVSIGSFDGIHLGHQKLLSELIHYANDESIESVLVSFHPHPRTVVRSETQETVSLLSTMDEKIERLAKSGIDHLYLAPFTLDFSRMTPEQYLESFIIKLFHPAVLVIGYDHRFGRERKGDVEFLKKMSNIYDYRLKIIDKQQTHEITVSSTRIRSALIKGKVTMANELLGYPYLLTGKVIRGKQIGRQLGYPTANLHIDFAYKLIPLEGVYLVRVRKPIDLGSYGMMYIGRRPTLSSNQEKSIEIHIFDFIGDIYNDTLQLELLQFIRKDKKFESLDALAKQLQVDEYNCRLKAETDYSESYLK